MNSNIINAQSYLFELSTFFLINNFKCRVNKYKWLYRVE